MGSRKVLSPCYRHKDFTGKDLSEKFLVGASCSFAIFRDTSCRRANMKDISLMFATIWVSDFEEAELISANMSFVDGWESVFRSARMMSANLTSFHGRGCNFRGADLTGATLERAQLYQADFRGANLTDANFRFANLRDALFDESTIINGAVFDGVLPEFLPKSVRREMKIKRVV